MARPFGGWVSDKANARWGARGRLWAQFIFVVFEGAFLLRFAAARTERAAAAYLLVLSAFLQAANGTCFALVPYLSSQSGACAFSVLYAFGVPRQAFTSTTDCHSFNKYTHPSLVHTHIPPCAHVRAVTGGAVAGIVASGGNVGSIIFTLMLAEAPFSDPSKGFAVMGYAALACAPAIWLISPKGLEEGHRQKQLKGKMGRDTEQEEGRSLEEGEGWSWGRHPV